jgi:TolB protein
VRAVAATLAVVGAVGGASIAAASADGQAAAATRPEVIAFARIAHDGTSDIFVVNADGSEERRITRTPAAEFLPSWSPDGKRIVLETWQPNGIQIAVVGVDGRG